MTFKTVLLFSFLCFGSAVFGFTQLQSEIDAKNTLCLKYGTIAFVQHRRDADIAIRFVASNEDVRISFHRNRLFASGMWRVVAKTENPDYLVFIDSYSRNETVNVKIVDYNPGCLK